MILAVIQPGTVSDYFDLFNPNAPWARSAAGVDVFQITGSLGERGSEEKLQQLFADLRRRNISLALAIAPLTTKSACGQNIEGYGPPGEVARLVERIRRLGGELRYVAMDGPLSAGHIYSGANACRSSIPALARDVAVTVRAIKQAFPTAQIGDIEGIGHADPPDLVDQIMQWTKAYEETVGEPLAFLRTNVLWSGPWRQQLSQLVPRLHATGIKNSIIYNGDPGDQTDLAWTSHAEERFAAIEADPTLIPDQAVLQTWMLHPSQMLPETQPGTMTWLVNRYLAVETRLALHRVGGRLEGQLTDTTGRPLAQAPVNLLAQHTGKTGAPVQHVLSGHVPQKAVAALFALRINTECGCSGQTDIAIGPLEYRDDRTGQTVHQAFRPATDSGDATLAHFHALPGQAILQNTSTFPVTASAAFTVRVPMVTDLASASTGYVALIFHDAQGKGLERQPLPFEPTERPIGMLTTDTQGRFSLLPDANSLLTSIGFRAEFQGDEHHRTASATVRQSGGAKWTMELGRP